LIRGARYITVAYIRKHLCMEFNFFLFPAGIYGQFEERFQ